MAGINLPIYGEGKESLIDRKIRVLGEDLKYQISRANGATIAMQELQAEFDSLKSWAVLGRLAFKAQKSICDSSYFTFYRCKDRCKNFDFCMQRDDMKGAELDGIHARKQFGR